MLLPAVGNGLGASLWRAVRCWISRDISSRWPCDIEDSSQVALGWDDTSLPAGPGWLCESSAPRGKLRTKPSCTCRVGKRPQASFGAGSVTAWV